MRNWLQQFREASSYTKQFFIHFVLYLVIILGIFVYAYARLL